MAKFVLSNNDFEFSEKVFQQISGTATGTKFALPYACIYMDEVETEFLQTQRFKLLVWLRFTDYIFFIWTHGKKNFQHFMKELNNFKSNLKFNFQCDRNSINPLNLNVKLNNGGLTTSVYIKPTDCHQYLHYGSSHPDHIKWSITFFFSFFNWDSPHKRHGVTRKNAQKRLQDTENSFRKNLQLKDVCLFRT